METLAQELELTRKLTLDAARAEKLAWKDCKRNPESDDLLQRCQDTRMMYRIMNASLVDVKARMNRAGR